LLVSSDSCLLGGYTIAEFVTDDCR